PRPLAGNLANFALAWRSRTEGIKLFLREEEADDMPVLPLWQSARRRVNTQRGGVVPMEYQTIIDERHGAVARIITNRPRYKNAQSRLMIEELDHAFAAANADDEVHVIILAAAGETFSSGHDIGTPEHKEDMRRRPVPKKVSGQYALSRSLFLDATLRWRNLDKPTIAQVQGRCIFCGQMFG